MEQVTSPSFEDFIAQPEQAYETYLLAVKQVRETVELVQLSTVYMEKATDNAERALQIAENVTAELKEGKEKNASLLMLLGKLERLVFGGEKLSAEELMALRIDLYPYVVLKEGTSELKGSPGRQGDAR